MNYNESILFQNIFGFFIIFLLSSPLILIVTLILAWIAAIGKRAYNLISK